MTEEQKAEFIRDLDKVKNFDDYYMIRKKIEISDPIALFNVPDSTMNSHLKPRDIDISKELELVKFALNNIKVSDAKTTDQIKIFISHSSADSAIGEKFLDALINLGVNEKNIFYSSKYHTGVKLGKDFHEVVRDALNSSEIVIFLLTRNFYKSAACLNEMGACWITRKEILPILLDGLTFKDMKGFIDSHYIAYTPNISDSFKLKLVLRPYINPDLKDKDAESVFSSFITEANEMTTKTSNTNINEEVEFSTIEKMILNGKFTDNELLLINYIYEKQTDYIGDFSDYDLETGKYVDSLDNIEIKNYTNQFARFDLSKAKNSLERSGFIEYVYVKGMNYDPDYNGFQVDIETFRDIISLSDECRQILEKTKAKNSKPKDILNQDTSVNLLQDIILRDDFKEIEGLFYSFVKDTYTSSLGDRWMADHTIKEIRQWENDNDLNNKLSSNYLDVLKILKHREFLEILETTSYGNPRLYKINTTIDKQIHKLNKNASNRLKKILKNNKYEEDLPF